MSQTTATTPTPWWRSPSLYTSVVALAAALPGFIPQIEAVVPPQAVPWLRLLAILCAAATGPVAHASATRNAAKLDLGGVTEAARVVSKDVLR